MRNPLVVAIVYGMMVLPVRFLLTRFKMHNRPHAAAQNKAARRLMHSSLLGVLMLMASLLIAPLAHADPPVPQPQQPPVPQPQQPRVPRPNQPQPQQPRVPRPNQPQPQQPAAQAPAVPEWVVPGAVITMNGASISGQKEFRPDRRTADGSPYFSQYDVLAVLDTGVLIEERTYMVYPLGGPPEMAGTQVGLVDLATGGGRWMLLADIANTQVTTDANAATQITKGRDEISGQTFDVISFITTQGNTTISRIYDQTTGMLLHRSDLTEDRRNRSHDHAEIVGYRVAQLPWLNTEFTPQIQALTKLTFRGALISIMPPAPDLNMPDIRYDIEAEFAFTAVTPGLIAVTITFDMDMPTGPNQTGEKREFFSPNQRLGLYIDPAVLVQLEAGQVLDEDPAIGYRLVVTDVYEVRGVTLVEITEQSRGNRSHIQGTYDASAGLQVASEWTQPEMGQRIEGSLDRVE